VREANRDEIEPIISIWASRMGEEYPNRDKIENCISKDTLKKTCLIAISRTNTILGFGISEVLSSAEAHTTIHNEKPISYNGDIGFLDQLCVTKGFENNGIGTELTRKRIDDLKSKNVTKIIAVSWNYKNQNGSNSILEKLGFEKHELIENYWFEDSIKKGYTCPCGHPCTCTGIIYTKDV